MLDDTNRPRPDPTQAPAPAIVGRDHELRILRTAVDDARARRTQLVEIVGEPGIGKSRLAAELPALAIGFYQHVAACDRLRESHAYFPVRSLLRAVAGIPEDADPAEAGALLDSWVAAVAPDVMPLLPLIQVPFDAHTGAKGDPGGHEPSRRRELMHRGIDALLARTLMTPTLLVFEDTQWMDTESRALLAHLVGSGPSRPWLVCVTRRPEGRPFAPDTGGVVIALQPLAVEAAKRLALGASAGAIHPSDLERIVARSEGNPFFLRELAADADVEQRLKLPLRVEMFLDERLDALEEEDRLLLSHAAAAGRTFSVEVIARTLASVRPAIDVDTRAAELSAFVEEVQPGTFRFRHDLIQEAAYAKLTGESRRAVHAQLAAALEEQQRADEDESAVELAWHFAGAEDWDKTWRYATLAARRAHERYANDVASELYERALVAVDNGAAPANEEVADVCEALGDVCALSGRFDQADDAFVRAERLAGADTLDRARIVRKRGQVCLRRSEYDEAMRVLESALALIPDPPPSRAAASQLAEIELGLGGIAFRQGRFADAEKWVARAADRAVREGSDAHVVAHAYYALEAARDYLGGDRSTTLRRKALAIYQELGDVSGEATTANNIGQAAYFAGQWNEALRFYRRAHALDRTAGNFESLAVHLNNEGEILSDQGHLDEAAAIFTEARSLFVTIDQAFGTAVTTSNLARVTVRSGRPGDAASGFDEALTVFEKIGAGSFGLETRARIGEMYVVAGEHRTAHDIAASTLEQLGESASPGLVALLERILGYAAFQNFEPDVAAEHFRRSLAAAQADRADFEAALTLVAAAELAERTGLEEPSILRAEGQEILDRLEVVALAPVPLPETFFEPREHRL